MPIEASLCRATYCSTSTGTSWTAGVELALVLDAELGGQRLRGEAHVHDAGRMAFGRGQVDEPALAEHVDRACRSSACTRRPACRTSAVTFVLSALSATRSSSTSKWPLLQTIAPSFIAAKCSRRMMCLLPVTVMKMSPTLAASAIGMTAKPSIAASRAAIGSTSVTMT